MHDVSGVHVLEGRDQLARIRSGASFVETTRGLASYVGVEVAASRQLGHEVVDWSALRDRHDELTTVVFNCAGVNVFSFHFISKYTLKALFLIPLLRKCPFVNKSGCLRCRYG